MLIFIGINTNLLFSEIPTPMAARTMKLVANSLIKLANLVDAKVLCVWFVDMNLRFALHLFIRYLSI